MAAYDPHLTSCRATCSQSKWIIGLHWGSGIGSRYCDAGLRCSVNELATEREFSFWLALSLFVPTVIKHVFLSVETQGGEWGSALWFICGRWRRWRWGCVAAIPMCASRFLLWVSGDLMSCTLVNGWYWSPHLAMRTTSEHGEPQTRLHDVSDKSKITSSALLTIMIFHLHDDFLCHCADCCYFKWLHSC